MKERPILFSTPMVKAILAGDKTMTRRVLKTQPTNPPFGAKFDADGFLWWELNARGNWLTSWQKCPFGMPGDRLWVRESWCVGAKNNSIAPRDLLPRTMSVMYKAGGSCSNGLSGQWECDTWPAEGAIPNWLGTLRPSIFMPRWASRITLEVTDVRCEQLLDISNMDAKCEGFVDSASHKEYTSGTAIDAFLRLWQSLNCKRGFGLETNPWVWVVSFKRVENT